MLASKSFSRMTRRGKVLRVLKEHYLRDDIICGLASCVACSGVESAAAQRGIDAEDSSGVGLRGFVPVFLSAEPSRSRILVLDTNIVLHQMDLCESAGAAMCDVVVLQTVMGEVKHRNLALYGRLLALMRDADRRFVPFANEHHRDTYIERAVGETANDYNDRAVRVAASWLSTHFAPAGLCVLLLTDDAASARLARTSGLAAASTREFVGEVEGADAAVTLRDLVAAVGASHTDSTCAADGYDDEVGATLTVPVTVAPAIPSVPAGRPLGAEGVAVARRRALYREHWTQSRIVEALNVSRAFQGTLRVNRECWFEARVAIHGISGKGASDSVALTGGDDVVSVLILGRDNINRAMEGDVVAIELLPMSEWRSPSRRLVVPRGTAEGGEDADDADEAAALEGGGTGYVSGAAETHVQVTASAADLRVALQNKARELETGAAVNTSDSGHAAAVAALRNASANPAAKGTGVIPTGRVVGVLQRAWRQYCGSLDVEDVLLSGVGPSDGGAAASSSLFLPVDPKIPRIRIETRQRAALADKRIIVAVDAWDSSSRFPRGHYVRTLGKIGDKAIETEVILLEHDIPSRPFSSDVLACLPPADWMITRENSAGRVDLRDIASLCSIDPPGCKDIDDALHARLLPSGNVEVCDIFVDLVVYPTFVYISINAVSVRCRSASTSQMYLTSCGPELQSISRLQPALTQHIWWSDALICFPVYLRRHSVP